MNNAATAFTSPTAESNTVASLSQAASALFAEWDAVHDAADDLPGHDAAAQVAANAQGGPMIAASAALVSLVTARRAVTDEDYRAKAALALLWCRNRADEDAGMDLILSLARDVLDLDRH